MNQQKIELINQEISHIIRKLSDMEDTYSEQLSNVHPIYSRSAENLIHYLAFRSFDIDNLQDKLRELSLPSLSNIEAHVKDSLLNIKTILNRLQGDILEEKEAETRSIIENKKLLKRNTKLLFGYKSKKRRTRIMVTLPGVAAEDPDFIYRLLNLGMNSARINCAHDEPETWELMIQKCRVMMDLGGPKLRTGNIVQGPKVIHIKPKRNTFGRVTRPAQIWIAPPGINPPQDNADAIIPIDEEWLSKLKKGNTISFTDTRGKRREINISNKEGEGRWGICYDSAYVETGSFLNLKKEKQSGEVIMKVGELLPIEESITLFPGDLLILHKYPEDGEPAQYDENGNIIQPAHISCTLPEIFDDVKTGEPIFFDDGKIEGTIEEVSAEALKIRISYAKDKGSRLRSDKGINLPESNLKISGLTEKDREDLNFICQHADAVNLSFVNTEDDVQELLDIFEELQTKTGIILKVETQKGFTNLPLIILRAMQTYPIGVMIARGDLAVETGWKNFASIQEEILRICEAAHIPDVWATQVLESLAKKGVPTRSEITDAAMAQRAECVMLNKGAYIEKAVKMLDKILRRMQRFNKKKETMLPRLAEADSLKLSHDKYNIQ